jgi:hypothetical protein
MCNPLLERQSREGEDSIDAYTLSVFQVREGARLSVQLPHFRLVAWRRIVEYLRSARLVKWP